MNERRAGSPSSTILDRLARRADLHTDALRERIAGLRERAVDDSDMHLTFAEAVDIRQLDGERDSHLADCDHCRGLVDALNPSQGTLDSLLVKALPTASTDAEINAGYGVQPVVAETKSQGPWQFATAVSTVTAISLLGVMIFQPNSQGLALLALDEQTKIIETVNSLEASLSELEGTEKLDAYFKTAGFQVVLNDPDSAYKYINAAFTEGHASTATLNAFDNVISPDEFTSYQDKIEGLWTLRHSTDSSDPIDILQRAQLQWRVGRPIDAYESFGLYLATAEPSTNLCEAYRSRFLQTFGGDHRIDCMASDLRN